MNTRNVNAAIICALCVTGTIVAAEAPVIHRTFADVQNVVTQKLAAARAGDFKELRIAKDSLFGVSTRDNVTIRNHITLEESFALRLEILKVACELAARPIDYDPEKIWPGAPGKIPWPPAGERPENLRGRPLWWTGTGPDGYKESDPELYAYYKPLYEEYLKNSRKHSQQESLQVVRKDLIREIRTSLGMGRPPQFRNAQQQYVQRREVVNKLIQDEQLRKELFAEEPPK